MTTRNALQGRLIGSLFMFVVLLCPPFVDGGVRAQGKSYTIQIASAPSEAEARSLVSELKAKGVEAYWVKAEVPGKGTRYRVRLGKFKAQADAKAQADRVLGQGWIKEFIVTLYEPPTEGKPAAESSAPPAHLAMRPEPAPTIETPAKAQFAPTRSEKTATPRASKPEPPPVVEKELAKAEPMPAASAQMTTPPVVAAPVAAPAPPEEKPAPVRKTEPKPEIRHEAATPERAPMEPARTIDARVAPASAPNPLPAIATPPVAEAVADLAISNDNWKVVRRSAETDKNLRAIHFVDSMTGWAAGDAGAVYRTTDGGRSWKPLLSGAPANINFIHFVDWNHGWMIGEKASRDDNAETLLFMTVNGGRTWSNKPMPDVLSVFFLDAKNGWAVGRNAMLLKTSDGGNEWVKVDSMDKLIGLPVESTSYTYGFRDIFFTDARHGWLIGNFYGRARSNIGGIFTTEDGGETWKRLPVTIQTQHASGRFTPGVFHSVRFTDANVGSVTGEMYDGEGRFFFVLHTRDGGKTWEQFRTPSRATHNTQFLDPSYGWSAAFAPREGGADAVVYDTTLMRTDNGGMSWRNDFTARGRRIHGVFFLSPSRGWAVGDRGMILRYEERGKAN